MTTTTHDDLPLWQQGHPLARSSDPITSHMGGASIERFLGGLQADALALVKHYPGRTASELAQVGGFPDPRRINRRLPELLREGLVIRGEARRCGVTGRMAYVWQPIEKVIHNA